MAKTITLRFPGTCADCGATLPVGARARWYGRCGPGSDDPAYQPYEPEEREF